MANKNVNILLKLQDQFTAPMVKAGKITADQQKALQKCSGQVYSFSRTVRSGFLGGVGHIAKFGAALAGISFAGLTAGFVGLAESTEEYRKAMGKLNTAYQAAGYSAQVAQEAYRGFYGILGDTDTATEASQLLAKLTQNEKDVSTWTRIAAGVSGTFGDSLPIEGLIEASNETAKVGKVTGVLADALNWAGISEDQFNDKLAAAGGEAQRNKLIMETLGATYETAAEAFYKNNEALVAAREQQAALQSVTGTLGEASAIAKGKLLELFGAAADGSVQSGSALEWVSQKAQAFRDKLASLDVSKYVPQVTEALQKIKDGVATAWGYIQPVLRFAVEHADALIPAILGVVGAISSISIIADVATKVSTFIGVAKSAINVIKLAGSAMKTLGLFTNLPIAALALLVVAFITAYNKSEKFRAFIQKLSDFLSVFADAVIKMKDDVVAGFQTLKEKVGGIIDKIKEKLQPLIDLVSSVKSGLDSLGFGTENADNNYSFSSLGAHATGTPYFPGGLTRINEGGRGEIVDLPNGTRIIPHDVATKTQAGTTVTVNLTIQGNVIGNRQYMEQTGQYIAEKILAAQGVV